MDIIRKNSKHNSTLITLILLDKNFKIKQYNLVIQKNT